MEYSVQRLLPIITREREKHRNRKKILKDLRQYVEAGRQLFSRSTDALGEEDDEEWEYEEEEEAEEDTGRAGDASSPASAKKSERAVADEQLALLMGTFVPVPQAPIEEPTQGVRR